MCTNAQLTMSTNEMLMIARYMPRRRRAGSATTVPIAAANSAPVGQASQNDQPARTMSSAVA
jgi:hypothetical protein